MILKQIVFRDQSGSGECEENSSQYAAYETNNTLVHFVLLSASLGRPLTTLEEGRDVGHDETQ